MNGTDSTNVLGDYLRARRELVRPEDVGIKPIGLRRVPGLRREEVAMLEGISSDYYLRLDQGRDRHPSSHVLEAIATVLRLDADATTYLLSLVGTRSELPHRNQQSAGEHRRPDQRLADQSRVRAEPVHRHPRREPAVRGAVPALRLMWTIRGSWNWWGSCPCAVTGSASCGAGADVLVPVSRTSRLNHPQVGELELRSNKFTVNDTDGLMLVVFHAPPASRSAELLGILGSLAASPDQSSVESPETERKT